QQPRVLEKISGHCSWPAVTNSDRTFLLQVVIHWRVLCNLGLGTFDSIVSRKSRSEFRVASNRVTQFLFARLQRRPDLRIKQSGQITVVTFAVVLIAEQIVACFPCVLERSRAV